MTGRYMTCHTVGDIKVDQRNRAQARPEAMQRAGKFQHLTQSPPCDAHYYAADE
ncbi:Hypothetical predicted protein, partial [Pelobates cultripes]